MAALKDSRAEKACQEYVLNGGDQSKAYRKGFPQSNRWKDATVWKRASELFKTREVLGRVKELQDEAAKIAEEEFGIDARWLLKRLVNEADADMADLMDKETGALKPIHEWPMVWRTGLVAGVEVNEITGDGPDGVKAVGRVQKVRLSERIKRLELIGKHVEVGAFNETINHKHSGEVVTRIELVPATSDDN